MLTAESPHATRGLWIEITSDRDIDRHHPSSILDMVSRQSSNSKSPVFDQHQLQPCDVRYTSIMQHP